MIKIHIGIIMCPVKDSAEMGVVFSNIAFFDYFGDDPK